jgi:hypothetical protein
MNLFLLFPAILIPPFLIVLILLAVGWWQRRKGRRSPLNVKVINLPGESLRRRLSKAAESYDEAMAMAMLIGPLFLAAWLLLRISRSKDQAAILAFGSSDWVFVLMGVGTLLWCLRKSYKNLANIRSSRQGLEAEIAVAQFLTPLIADGAFVFHDLPADKFNIDHIVVGRSAVFAVETKSRKKPAEQGKDSARVIFDGKQLRFPEHVEVKPVEQARFQAQWLEQFLSSGVGEAVRVVPVLALPGWFVENSGPRSDVLATNCRNPSFMTGDKFGPPLSDAMRKRIAHVISERYEPLELD